LKNPTVIKRKRPGESRRSKLVRRTRVTKEVKRQEGEGRLRSRVTSLNAPNDLSNIKPKSKDEPSYVGRYLLGSGPKYIPIRGSCCSKSKLKEPLPTPRSHNYRRKALITTTNIKNCNKNKSSSSGSNFNSEIYNFSILFSTNPVSFGMSIHALAAHTKTFNGKSKKKKMSHLRGGWCDTARRAKHQDLIESVLIKALYQEEGMSIFAFSSVCECIDMNLQSHLTHPSSMSHLSFIQILILLANADSCVEETDMAARRKI